MKGVWVVPVIFSILFIGSLGLTPNAFAIAETASGTDEEVIAAGYFGLPTVDCSVDTGKIVALDTYNGASEGAYSTLFSDLTGQGFTGRLIDTSVDGIPSCVQQLLIVSQANDGCLTRSYSAAQITTITSWVNNGGELNLQGEWTSCGDGTRALITAFGHTPGANTSPLQLVSISGTHYDPNVPATMWSGVNAWRILAGHTYDSDPDVVSVDNNDRGTMVAKEFGEGCVVITTDSNWDGTQWIGLQDNRPLASNVHKYLDECTADQLEEILMELKDIWMFLRDDVFTLLLSIETTVNNIVNEITDEEHGLAEIKREVRIIEQEITDEGHGLEEIKREVSNIETQLENLEIGSSVRDNVIVHSIELEEGQSMVIVDNAGIGGTSDVEVTWRFNGDDDDEEEEGGCVVQAFGVIGGSPALVPLTDDNAFDGIDSSLNHADVEFAEAIVLSAVDDDCEIKSKKGEYVSVSTIRIGDPGEMIIS